MEEIKLNNNEILRTIWTSEGLALVFPYQHHLNIGKVKVAPIWYKI